MPIEEYERLLEDVKDLAAIAERRNEPRISLEELERGLKAFLRGTKPSKTVLKAHGPVILVK